MPPIEVWSPFGGDSPETDTAKTEPLENQPELTYSLVITYKDYTLRKTNVRSEIIGKTFQEALKTATTWFYQLHGWDCLNVTYFLLEEKESEPLLNSL